MTATTLLQRGAPIVVSVAVLAWLASSVETHALLALLTPRVGLVLVPALLAYCGVSLFLEAQSLLLLVESPPAGFGAVSAARIKCASYLLGIVHFALGAGTLVLLLSRRTRLSIPEATGRVLFITFTDVLLIFVIATLSGSLIEQITPPLRLLLLCGAVGGVGGLLLLRATFSLGPLNFARDLPVLRELRLIPTPQLLRLLVLRLFFVASFVGVCWASFVAFEVEAPFSLIVVGMLIVGFIGGLPIAVGGLGTTQLAVMAIFAAYAPPETLLAKSLALSTGMLFLRGVMGALFARELTREAWRERGATA
jgi:uncharacterized membrane protein YbhN (UPF0104 family)